MKTPDHPRRLELLRLLGDLPRLDRPVAGLVIDQTIWKGIHLERLILDLNGIESVSAFYVRPLEGAAPFPVVLYNHYHGGEYGTGKNELLQERSETGLRSYAEELTSLGYAALCIDHWGFGERQGRSESEIFKQMLWQGQVMWGMMVYDSLKAIDYLLSRADVDPDQVVTLGMSMGSTMAWWIAALDERISACVDICCLTDYQALIEARGLDGHGIYYYVPGLLKHFTAAEINALIAPRPHLGLAGDYDLLTPPSGLDKLDAELRTVYAQAGAPEAWTLLRYPVGHMETAEMRSQVIKFLHTTKHDS